MTKTRAGTVLLAIIGAAVVALLVGIALVLRDGISARPEPSLIEATVARRLRHWAIPDEAIARRNPVPLDSRVLADARAHFADHCAQCHANDGSGNTAIGRNLYPRAPDMRLSATQDLTDGEILWIIENGVRFTGMPGWKAPGSEQGSWKLVHFIRHLPRLTPQEKLEMEELNPRSAEEWKESEEEQRFLDGDEGARDGGEHLDGSGRNHHPEEAE